MSFPRYPEYKDSGVEFLGEVPAHWAATRVKRVLDRLGAGGTPDTSNPEFWSDETGIGWVAIADMSDRDTVPNTAKKITERGRESKGLEVWPTGTLLFSMYASLGHIAELEIEACTNQAILALLPKAEMHGRFLKRWFEHLRPKLKSEASSNTQDNLNAEKVANLPAILPPRAEQTAIVAFLDRETAKIDALVAEQEKLIALLKEKRQAVISHAVTKGLDPNAPMKPSGIEWLGDVPAHWHISPLKWLTDPQRPIMYGIVLPGPDVGEGIPILKGGNVKPSRMNLDSMARTTAEIEAPFARARLKAGDLVYSIRGSIGDCEPVPLEMEGANITQDVGRVAVDSKNSASWVRWALLASAVREELASGSLGAAIRGVNIFDLKRANIPTPPPAEQHQIASYLDLETGQLDALMCEANQGIDLLKERRSALISAAVTGQIDVRHLAPATTAA